MGNSHSHHLLNNQTRSKFCNGVRSDHFVAAVRRQLRAWPHSQWFTTLAPQAEESGKLQMVASTGNPSATIQCFAPAQSERLVHLIPTRTQFMLAWVNRRFEVTFRMVMACTNPTMRARPGRERVWKILARFPASGSIRRIRTSFTLPRRDTFGPQTNSA